MKRSLRTLILTLLILISLSSTVRANEYPIKNEKFILNGQFINKQVYEMRIYI